MQRYGIKLVSFDHLIYKLRVPVAESTRLYMYMCVEIMATGYQLYIHIITNTEMTRHFIDVHNNGSNLIGGYT